MKQPETKREEKEAWSGGCCRDKQVLIVPADLRSWNPRPEWGHELHDYTTEPINPLRNEQHLASSNGAGLPFLLKRNLLQKLSPVICHHSAQLRAEGGNFSLRCV